MKKNSRSLFMPYKDGGHITWHGYDLSQARITLSDDFWGLVFFEVGVFVESDFPIRQLPLYEALRADLKEIS